MSHAIRCAVLGVLVMLPGGVGRSADETAETAQKTPPVTEAAEQAEAAPLNPQQTVLVDAARKRLLLNTKVVQREAMLEMFLCKVGTKEHETIVSIDSDAYVIHAGLLAIGARPGAPVEFAPDYKPPTGQIIDVFVNWTDENGRPHREKAQKWIRRVTRRYYVAPLKSLPAGFAIPDKTELRHDPKRGELIWFGPMSEAERDRLLALSQDKAYQQAIRTFYSDSQSKEMDAEFVFAGSGFFIDANGKRHYMAESGNIICVANFADATIDVAARSTAQNDDLMFEPYTERVPPVGTKVMVELVPRAEKE